MKTKLKAIAIAAATVTTAHAVQAQQTNTTATHKVFILTPERCVYDNVTASGFPSPIRVGIKGEEATFDIGNFIITLNQKGDVVSSISSGKAVGEKPTSQTLEHLKALVETYRKICAKDVSTLKL